MTEALTQWLESEGWEVLSGGEQGGLEARRERVERVEVLYVGSDNRLRYIVTRPVGEEDFRRVDTNGHHCRVISRSYTETTVTLEFEPGSLQSAIRSAIRASRSDRSPEQA